MSVAVRRAIYGKLAGDTTLTNLLGTPPTGVSKSIYHENAAQGARFPYVIFFKASGVPRYAIGALAMDNETWTIKGVDKSGSADTADGIATRLDALLTDGTISISGKTQLYLRREDDVEYEEVIDGVRYKHSGARYRLVYQSS
jgi:hypothetical protein